MTASPAWFTGVARNFDWEILWRYFGDVIMMMSQKLRHNLFFKFYFLIISLKNLNLDKSRNFRSQYRKLKRVANGEHPAVDDFWRFITKIMQFKHIIQPKNLNKSESCSLLVFSSVMQHFNWGRVWPTFGYALAAAWLRDFNRSFRSLFWVLCQFWARSSIKFVIRLPCIISTVSIYSKSYTRHNSLFMHFTTGTKLLKMLIINTMHLTKAAFWL